MNQSWKTPFRVSLASALFCGALACGVGAPVSAQDEPVVAVVPTPLPKMPSGPSAKMAARLKREPPPAPSWVAHYLPDDRYKVAGGIWKYVSTELDTYYHLPNSPLMMRQPNSMVIGFSSREQAEEAGYRPDNTVAAQIKATEIAKMSAASGIKTFAKATTITLGDGESKVTVPAGWQHVKSPMMAGMKNFSIDIFVPKGGSAELQMPKRGQKYTPPQMVMLMTAVDPRGTNLEMFMQRDFLKTNLTQSRGSKELMAGMSSQNPQFGQFTSMWQDIEVTPSNWGGARAVKITAKKGSKNPAMMGSSIMAARGSKLYIFQDGTGGSAGARQIRNSFIAR